MFVAQANLERRVAWIHADQSSIPLIPPSRPILRSSGRSVKISARRDDRLGESGVRELLVVTMQTLVFLPPAYVTVFARAPVGGRLVTGRRS
jgi:hypothetical protein